MIYLPFLSIVLIVAARGIVFDAMDFSLPLIIVIGLSLIYAIYSQLILRKCAIEARAKAIRDYEALLFKAQARSDPTPKLSADQIELLMERIRNTREGSFARLSQQPVFQALLLPFGGYGGVQLIEYLIASTLTG